MGAGNEGRWIGTTLIVTETFDEKVGKGIDIGVGREVTRGALVGGTRTNTGVGWGGKWIRSRIEVGIAVV
jgi:hypothetical protein